MTITSGSPAPTWARPRCLGYGGRGSRVIRAHVGAMCGCCSTC